MQRNTAFRGVALFDARCRGLSSARCSALREGRVAMGVLFAAMVLAVGPMERSTSEVDCRLVVRVYDAVGLPAQELEQARITVAAIFQEVGAEVTWRACPRSANIPSADACDDRRGKNDVILRLISTRPIAASSVSDKILGYSRLPAIRSSDSFVTVFVNRVRDLAERGSVGPGTLLGRVVAHELGHVFLGAGHSPAGLMRPRWKLEELWTNGGHWRFTLDERLGMRKTLLTSSGTP
jgi:hypothetical protein